MNQEYNPYSISVLNSVNDSNEEIEDIGYIDTNNKFVPNPHLKNYNPRITTMGSRKRGSLVTPGQKNKPNKNNVSYDDILRSLNMKVDNNGVLVITRGDAHALNNNSKINNNIPITQNKVDTFFQKQNNSSIHNKIHRPLFSPNNYIPLQKSSNDENSSIPLPSLTPEQIKQNRIQYAKMLLKRQQDANRINQIKSKKMIFSNLYNNQSIKPSTPNNKFFNLSK